MDAGSPVVNSADLLEQLPEPFIVVDRGWRISFANEMAAAALGAPRPSLVGGSLWEKYSRLGLALSKAFIEMMGGRIGLDSPGSGGSVFWIELPADESPVERFERVEFDGVLEGRGAHV